MERWSSSRGLSVRQRQSKVFQFDKDLCSSSSKRLITLFTNRSFKEHKIASFGERKIPNLTFTDQRDFTVVEDLHVRNNKRTVSGYFPIETFPTCESIRIRFTTASHLFVAFTGAKVNVHNYNFVKARANNERFVTITECHHHRGKTSASRSFGET